MDPITAFAMAQSALQMIRKGVDFYKECKKLNADVTEITHEVTGHMGKFMDAAEVVKVAADEQKNVVPKKGTPGIASQALDNIMRSRQIIQAETELREMLIYETPGLGGLWDEFVQERARLRKLQDAQEKAEKDEEQRKRQAAISKMLKRKAMLRRYQVDAIIGIAGVVVAGFIGFSMVLVAQNRIEKYPQYGNELIPVSPNKQPATKYIYTGR